MREHHARHRVLWRTTRSEGANCAPTARRSRIVGIPAPVVDLGPSSGICERVFGERRIGEKVTRRSIPSRDSVELKTVYPSRSFPNAPACLVYIADVGAVQ